MIVDVLELQNIQKLKYSMQIQKLSHSHFSFAEALKSLVKTLRILKKLDKIFGSTWKIFTFGFFDTHKHLSKKLNE